MDLYGFSEQCSLNIPEKLVNTEDFFQKKTNWTFCAKGLSLNVNLNNEVQCQMSILGNTK